MIKINVKNQTQQIFGDGWSTYYEKMKMETYSPAVVISGDNLRKHKLWAPNGGC
jgi:hypothetical protein